MSVIKVQREGKATDTTDLNPKLSLSGHKGEFDLFFVVWSDFYLFLLIVGIAVEHQMYHLNHL